MRMLPETIFVGLIFTGIIVFNGLHQIPEGYLVYTFKVEPS